MRLVQQAHCLFVIAALAAAGCGAEEAHDVDAPVTTQPAGEAGAKSSPSTTQTTSKPPAAQSSGAAGTSQMAAADGGTAGKPSVSTAAASGGAGGGAAAATGGGSGGAGGTGGAGGASTSAAAGSSGAAGMAAAAEADADIPCPVFEAFARSCHACHGDVPANGAPMSLTHAADFQVVSVSKAKIPKYDLARMRIDGTRRPPMPPDGWPMTDDDKKTMLDWLTAQAPAATDDTPACH